MSKYQEILSQIQTQIEQGHLKRGQKLPSIRQLSQDFSCNKDTVQRALLDLKFQRIIYSKPKSGYYVLGHEQEAEDLEVVVTDGHEQAYEDFRLCVNETLIGRENYLFNYYHQQEGLEDLLVSVRRLLLDSAVYARPEDLVITSGTQQALSILSQLDFPNGKQTILLEQPTYSRMNDLVRTQGLSYATIERRPDGLDLKHLEEIFRQEQIKCFYTIPRFHNPLGHSFIREDKEAILELAEAYDVYLIEDDYLADFDSRQEPTFHYLDRHQRVIYLKSFSSILFPALRLAACVLPPAICKPFLAYKTAMDYDSNLILQKALSLYIDNGMFAKNRSLLRKMEEQMLAQMTAQVEQVSPKVPYTLSPQGILLDLRNIKQLAALKHSGLGLDFFETSYLSACPYDYARLSPSTDLTETIKKVNQFF